MPSFPPFLFMSTAQEGRLSSKRRFPELGTYAPALLNPVSRRSVRWHRNRGSYRPQNRAKCGHFIPGLTMDAIMAAQRRVQSDMLRDHITAVSRTAITGGLSETDCNNM